VFPGEKVNIQAPVSLPGHPTNSMMLALAYALNKRAHGAKQCSLQGGTPGRSLQQDRGAAKSHILLISQA